MYILHINFWAISFNRSHDITILKIKFWKTRDCSLPSKATPSKIISMLSLKISKMRAKFCTIPCNRIRDRTTKTIWEKNRVAAPSIRAICTQIASLCFLMIYFLHINFCPVSSSRNRDLRIRKNSEKVKLQRHLLSDLHQKLVETNLCLNNTKHKISWNSVKLFLNYTCHKILVIYRQTGIFQK